MALSDSTRQTIAGLVQQKRALQTNLRLLREEKRSRIESINYSIRSASDKNSRASLRNNKTATIDMYTHRIHSFQDQIYSIANTIRSYRG